MTTKCPDVWMPVYLSEYLMNTLLLTTEQHGAYFLLRIAAWKSGGVLPNDPEQLQAITRLPPAKWKANEKVLRAFFVEHGDALHHEDIKKELAAALQNMENKSAAGRKGAYSRHAKSLAGNVTPLRSG